MMFRSILFTFVTLLIICSTLVACGPKEITFPDSNLEAAIRDAIDKPEGAILASDCEGLTSLDASERYITDLSGLEYCTNLTELQLWNNQISDISPLASLTNLTILELRFNQISDISPLASLTNLTTLDLWNNQISDISPLASLNNLTELNLRLNPLNEVSIEVYIPQLEAQGVDVGW